MKRYKRQPFLIFQTIANFLKYNKKEIAEIDSLTASEVIEEKDKKRIKGNMILLKVDIQDLDLHYKFSQNELAEIIIRFVDCEDQKAKKVNFPLVFDFKKLRNSSDKFNDNNNSYFNNEKAGKDKEILLSNEINNTKKKSSNLINFIQPKTNSPAINIAIAIYLSAKFLRRILKQAKNILQIFSDYSKTITKGEYDDVENTENFNNFRNNNSSNINIEKAHEIIENLEALRIEFNNNIFKKTLDIFNEEIIKINLSSKIESLFTKIYNSRKLLIDKKL